MSVENCFTQRKIHNFTDRYRVTIGIIVTGPLVPVTQDRSSELDIPPDPPSPGMSRRPHKLERNVTMRGNDRPQTIPECPPWKIWRLRRHMYVLYTLCVNHQGIFLNLGRDAKVAGYAVG